MSHIRTKLLNSYMPGKHVEVEQDTMVRRPDELIQVMSSLIELLDVYLKRYQKDRCVQISSGLSQVLKNGKGSLSSQPVPHRSTFVQTMIPQPHLGTTVKLPSNGFPQQKANGVLPLDSECSIAGNKRHTQVYDTDHLK